MLLCVATAVLSVAGDAGGAPTASPTQKLLRDGYVVFDNVLSPSDLTAVRESAERLFSSGALNNLGQSGRDDDIVALPPGNLQHNREKYGDLIAAARVLMSLPSMLVQGARSDADTPAERLQQFEQCTAPSRLMLARYPPSAGRYVPHLDNDPSE